MQLMGLDLPIPDHTQLSRRVRTLLVQIPRRECSGPLHVVIDSTSLKVFGEQDTGYHRRSLAENAMYRLKQLFGEAVASRHFESQVNEVHARIAAMNRMTDLGMPQSVRLGVSLS